MVTSFDGRCRQASGSDIATVARIHINAFPDFFLTQLGYKFLCVMYRAFLSNPFGIFIVHQSESGKLTGFAVGVFKSGEKDRWIALRFLPQFFFAVLPAIVRHPKRIVLRLASRFFDANPPFDVPHDAAVLRSIAVLPVEQGGGAAAALIDAFEQISVKHGANYVYLTTDQDNNERAQNFYKRHGYSVVKPFRQNNQRWMWLMSKSLREVCS